MQKCSQLIIELNFLNSDVDNFYFGKYDLIISNPPYIKKLDLKYLENDVINLSLKLALRWWIRWNYQKSEK